MHNYSKLFKAYSFMFYGIGKANLLFEYFKMSPPREVIDYSKVIKGYDQLTEKEKQCSEEYVNEFFTQEEFEMFRAFLKKNNGERHMIFKECCCPIKVKYPYIGNIMPPLKERYRFDMELFEFRKLFSKYDLPFEVFGYIQPIDFYPENMPNESHLLDGRKLLDDAICLLDPNMAPEDHFDQCTFVPRYFIDRSAQADQPIG